MLHSAMTKKQEQTARFTAFAKKLIDEADDEKTARSTRYWDLARAGHTEKGRGLSEGN